MEGILKNMGIQDMAAMLGVFMTFIGVCAFVVSLITEALKTIKQLNRLPTKLLCYIVAAALTPAMFCALMAYLGEPLAWFTVLAAFLASFVVAKVSMGGWDDVTELARRLIRK